MPGASPDSHTTQPLLLPYQPPYDWDALLNFLSFRAIAGVEKICNDNYLRGISYNGQTGWIRVSNEAARNALRVTIHLPDPDALPFIISRVQNIFDLSANPAAIGAVLSADPLLAPFVSARPGLRVPGAWDGFELAVRAILGQQITVSAATRLAGRLVSLFGEALPANDRIGGLTHLFPVPGQLIHRDIAQIGMPRARGAAIARLAAGAIANAELFSAYPSLDDAVKCLHALPGIGEWTAQYIAMRCLRENDAFPVGDVALMRALSDLAQKRITSADLLARAEVWRPWRAYAAQHLWPAEGAAISPAPVRTEPCA